VIAALMLVTFVPEAHRSWLRRDQQENGPRLVIGSTLPRIGVPARTYRAREGWKEVSQGRKHSAHILTGGQFLIVSHIGLGRPR
jgi:hypothetical protein